MDRESNNVRVKIAIGILAFLLLMAVLLLFNAASRYKNHSTIRITAASLTEEDMPAEAEDPFDAYSEVGDFDEDGMAIVKKDGKYGFADLNGSLSVDCVYDKLLPFDNHGMAMAKKDGLWGWIGRQGERVIDFVYDEAYAFDEDDMAIVKQGSYYGWINRENEVVIPLQFTDVSEFNGKYAKVRINSWGVIGRNGFYLVQPIYDSINILDDYIQFKQDGYWGMMSKSGKIIIGAAYGEDVEITDQYIFISFYDYVKPFSRTGQDMRPDNIYACTRPKNGGSIGLYDDGHPNPNGREYCLLDENFNLLIDTVFDHASEFSSAGYSVTEICGDRENCWVYDLNGDCKFVIPAVWGVYTYANTYFAVSNYGCVTNLRTDEIVQYGSATPVDGTNCIIVKAQDTGLYSLYDGEKIVKSGYTDITHEGTKIYLHLGNTVTEYTPSA